MPKYLIHMGICGFGNQLLGFKEACIIAKHTNRTIIEPIFIPHGTIRNECRKFYTFSDIFDSKYFHSNIKTINFKNINSIKINNVYNIRNINEDNLTTSYYKNQKDYYNISDVTFKRLKNKFITNLDELKELNEIEDDILVLLGTFNSVKLNTCSKNGCLNSVCGYHKVFLNDYNEVSKALIFNNNINNITNTVLNSLNLKSREFCTFHLRTRDLCENTLFKDSYNDYDESIVYQSIVNYLFENNKQNLINKIFVCLPPQALKIRDLKIFNSDKIHILDHGKYNYDSFILSIIELNICEQSQVLIYSPTNTPYMKKVHTRSSFVLHTMDLRRINNISASDICIDKIYNINIDIDNNIDFYKIDDVELYNIQNIDNKKVISFTLYNDKEIYNYGVLVNHELKKIIFKDWIMRIYVDESVNKTLLNYIIKNLKDIEVIKIKSELHTVYYRCFPHDDPSVSHFISRDLDSIITPREEFMVNEWLKSNKSLHLIHEVLPGHRMKIMAGMYGFRNEINNINIRKIDENTMYTYKPFGGLCKVLCNKDNITIYKPDSPNKNCIIDNKLLVDFYNFKEIDCKWCGVDQNIKIQLQENNNVKVLHKHVTYFFNFNSLFQGNISSSIKKFYNDLNRNNKKYLYLDDQTYLEQFYSNYLNIDNCIDHNSNLKWDYSVDLNKPYKYGNSIIENKFNITDFPYCYVGHRIMNMKQLYFQFFPLRLFKQRLRSNDTIDSSYLSSMCDWDFWSEYGKFRGDINKPPKTVYVKFDYIHIFYKDYFKYIKAPFILVTGGGDKTAITNVDYRWNNSEINETVSRKIHDSKFLIRWFVENGYNMLNKMVGIPTGVFQNKTILQLYSEQFIYNNIRFNKLNVYVRHRTRNWCKNRLIVNKLCKKEWSKLVDYFEGEINPDIYRKNLMNYAFTLCVNGGGIDPSPKAFESILCGSIPIIKRYDGVVSAYRGLPVIFIDDWKPSTITKEKLSYWLETKREYYENFYLRNNILYKLSSEYWYNYITSSNICIILTSTINTNNNINFNNDKNKMDRLKRYNYSINHWINNTKLNIVLVENSGFTYPELEETSYFEKIIYDVVKTREYNYLKNSKAKGQYECHSINYAFKHSNLLKKADYIIKVTGRFFPIELETVLYKNLHNNIRYIRQNNINKCEIVGCHKSCFNKLFNFPVSHNHVETSYRNIIKNNIPENILTLPTLNLPKKCVRGNGTSYDML